MRIGTQRAAVPRRSVPRELNGSQRPVLRRVLRLSCALAFGALSLPIGAQSEPERRLSPAADVVVRESIDVRLVQFDAIVTDRSNEPILDLEPKDFQLRVDGKKVKITSVSQGRELRNTVSGRLTIVLLIDERHIQSQHRAEILRAVEASLLEEVAQHPTWIAIAALGEELSPLLGPTRDTASIRYALERAAQRPLRETTLRALQRSSVQEIRDLLRNFMASGSTYRFAQASQAGVIARLASYGEALAVDTSKTIFEVQALVEALSFVPGRKAVLLLSDGLPRSPLDLVGKTLFDRLSGGDRNYTGDDLISAPASTTAFNDPTMRPTGGDQADNSGYVRPIAQQDDGGALQFQRIISELDQGPMIDRLAALANTHQVTFYPVKPPILDPSLSGLSERTSDRAKITALTDMSKGLESLSALTGGLSFVADTGVTDFLRQAQEDLDAYYALSFLPPRAMRDSGLREMTLKVRRRQASLRYRASYWPLTLQESLESRAWGTLLFGWQDNVHEAIVETVDLKAEGKLAEAPPPEVHPVDVVLSLPIGRLELASIEGMALGAFRVALQLQRDGQTRLRAQHVAFDVRIPVADLEVASSQYFAVRTGLKLSPGRYKMSVALWEENTGQTSIILHELAVSEDGDVLARGDVERPSGTLRLRPAL